MRKLWIWLPLGLFVLFFGTVAWKLYRPGDTNHPSKLIGKPMPLVALPPAASDRPGLVPTAKGPHLVNVFASWCVPCATEAPVLAALTQQGVVIDGIAIRDRRADLDAFLARHGNPYRAIGSDPDSQVQIALGSSGVPETFVVDGRGIIRYQHIGDITPEDVPTVLAKLDAAQ